MTLIYSKLKKFSELLGQNVEETNAYKYMLFIKLSLNICIINFKLNCILLDFFEHLIRFFQTLSFVF